MLYSATKALLLLYVAINQSDNGKWNTKFTGSMFHDDTFSELTLHHVDRFSMSTLLW